MLPATIGATGDVQLQVLVEAGQALFQFFNEPAGESLRLGDGELAEFAAAAGDSPAKKRRAAYWQSDFAQLLSQFVGSEARDVDDQQVLHVGSAQLAVGEAFGEIGCGFHLLGRNPTAQNRGAYIAIAGLLLWVDADVIAVNVGGCVLGFGGIELKSDAALEVVVEVTGSPTMAQEEKFQARALAMFAQLSGIAK